MDEKKYEAGKVIISSTEYRELIEEKTTAKCEASEARSERWRIDRERDKLKAELEKAMAQIDDLKKMIVGVTNNGI